MRERIIVKAKLESEKISLIVRLFPRIGLFQALRLDYTICRPRISSFHNFNSEMERFCGLIRMRAAHHLSAYSLKLTPPRFQGKGLRSLELDDRFAKTTQMQTNFSISDEQVRASALDTEGVRTDLINR